MKSFNVLDRALNVHKDYLLEASAGTGKTFSIENIVTRLLTEGREPIPIDQILVVTFTRAATRDLKSRIRTNIEKVLKSLKENALNLPDYVQAIQEKGQEAIKKACKSLEEALFIFDQAQIFTIHSFCSRMLRDHVLEGDFAGAGGDEQLPNTQLISIIRDFFRTQMTPDLYSPAQINIVLKKHDNKMEELEQELLKLVGGGAEVQNTDGFAVLLERFKKVMIFLKKDLGYNCADLLADFELRMPHYKSMADADHKVGKFAALFDKQDWTHADFDLLIKDQLAILQVLDPSRLKVKSKPPQENELHYPDLNSQLEKHLQPLVVEASSYAYIFARMAHQCQKMVRVYLDAEEKFRFDDLLKLMLQAAENPAFVDKVRERYRVAIIDEFQDTDPLQWEVFRMLFLGKRPLYLVGDPKQSIYAFRQADIYTYLAAADSLGAENHASLDVNHRSQPSLVEALNYVFARTKGLITLPRLGKELTYPAVKASNRIKEVPFSDPLGSLHFFIAEESEAAKSFPPKHFEETYYFPFILQEILRLNSKNGFKYSQQAILVKDRFQAQKLAVFLKEYQVPALLQRTSSLYETVALQAMKELLAAILAPKDESALKIALGGPILRWTHKDVEALEDPERLEAILGELYVRHHALLEKGFALFFKEFLSSHWKQEGFSVAEAILAQAGGDDFYKDLIQIAELLSEYQSASQSTPEGLLSYLNDLEILHINDDERIKIRRNNNLDAVQILTLHSSKGLEFDIVFALGLMNRSKDAKIFLPMQEGLKSTLVPLLDTNSREYLDYCAEIEAEKLRQLYVAMTRAKYRLYVPAAFAPVKSDPEPGSTSPMELFLEGLVGNCQDKDALLNFLQSARDQASISYNLINPSELVLDVPSPAPFVELNPPSQVVVNQTAKYMLSFTQLAQSHAAESRDRSPRDYLNPNKSIHTLPSGIKTGIFIHTLFESYPWRTIGDPEALRDFVQHNVQGSGFEAWGEVIEKMLRDVFRADLGPFRLQDIAANKIYREIEFIYPQNNQDGFLKGVIDLVCEYEGKYYLIDWKTNWLGPTSADYHQDNMRKAMEEHDYFLQVKFYKEALRRYFGLVDPRAFEDCFGGVIYLFVRGLDSSSTKGIFLCTD